MSDEIDDAYYWDQINAEVDAAFEAECHAASGRWCEETRNVDAITRELDRLGYMIVPKPGMTGCWPAKARRIRFSWEEPPPEPTKPSGALRLIGGGEGG